jgi:hypothetical protein
MSRVSEENSVCKIKNQPDKEKSFALVSLAKKGFAGHSEFIPFL